jgi:hypothetical protein
MAAWLLDGTEAINQTSTDKKRVSQQPQKKIKNATEHAR